MKILSFFIILLLSTNLIAQEEKQSNKKSHAEIRMEQKMDQVNAEKKSTTLTKIGEEVPSFDFEDLEGNKYNIADFNGKTVLINFFATWCGPCMKELPELEEALMSKYDKEDFVLLVIGRKHSVAEMQEFAAKNSYSFTIVADPDRSIYDKFAEKYIPRNYLINKKGEIVYQAIGFTEEEFAGLLAKIELELKK